MTNIRAENIFWKYLSNNIIFQRECHQNLISLCPSHENQFIYLWIIDGKPIKQKWYNIIWRYDGLCAKSHFERFREEQKTQDTFPQRCFRIRFIHVLHRFCAVYVFLHPLLYIPMLIFKAANGMNIKHRNRFNLLIHYSILVLRL